ncbi:MAG: LptF/LptG family permease [Treponema sp.]|nr:LptF/LptG family permease [Candidatus Treponema merdequi]
MDFEKIKETAIQKFFLILAFLKRKYIGLKFRYRMYKTNYLVRYIVKELLIYFFVMFLFYFLVFFVNQILVMMLKLLGKNLPFWDVVLLMFYSIPSIISQTAPFAVLTGFLMCLGRMNSDNEILILRASGQNPRSVILIPVLIIGLIVSVFSFFVNDFLLPAGLIKYKEQYLISISRNPFIEIESNTVKHLNENTIVTGEVKNSSISDIVFLDRDDEGNQRIIIAKKSSVDTAEENGVSMQLNMNDASIFVLDKKDENDYNLITADKMRMNIFESSFIDPMTGVSPNEMTTYDIHKEIKKIKQQEDYQKETLNQYVIEFNKKYALSFGALFFAFLALPLALIFGKQNGVFIGLIVGVLISVLYWSLIWIFMLAGYRNGLNGFLAMWIPNFVIGAAGLGFYSVMVKQ